MKVSQSSHFAPIDIANLVEDSRSNPRDYHVVETGKVRVIAGKDVDIFYAPEEEVVLRLNQRTDNCVLLWDFEKQAVYYREVDHSEMIEYPLSEIHLTQLATLPELIFNEGDDVFEVFNNVLELP